MSRWVRDQPSPTTMLAVSSAKIIQRWMRAVCCALASALVKLDTSISRGSGSPLHARRALKQTAAHVPAPDMGDEAGARATP